MTAQQYDQARTAAAAAAGTVAASEAAVEEARLNLQYATIRAPISGRTGSLRVREGNLVRAADAAPLVTINQIRPILVRFAVPAANLPLIQRYRGESWWCGPSRWAEAVASEGQLTFVDNAVDTSTGTILLKGTFANNDGALWPGEFVNVQLRLYVERDALVVPATAVVTGQQGSFVFVVSADGSAATKPVKLGRTGGRCRHRRGRAGARRASGHRRAAPAQQGSKVEIKAAADSAA